jgi:hypothetical protein
MSCDAKQAVLLASYSMQGEIKGYLFCYVNTGKPPFNIYLGDKLFVP